MVIAPNPEDQRPLSVGVFICLEWHPKAGGHVKCWERYAEAATHLGDRLDLTLYFLGEKEAEIPIAENVRYRLLPPQFSTARLEILRQGGGNTDVATYHHRLRSYLEQHHVFHLTDTFSFAHTVRQFCRRHRRPLVSSLHTDLPLLTRTYSREIIIRMSGNSPWGKFWQRFWLDWLQINRLFVHQATQKLKGFMVASDRILISRRQDYDWLTSFMPPERIGWFRRGIDRHRFHPDQRQPEHLRQLYGLPPQVPLLLFVGRVDESKNVLLMAQAARCLLDQGYGFHVLVAGEGAQSSQVEDCLGDAVTLIGHVPQDRLGMIYASSDLFVFPSESETGPNVVVEARAAGLPVVISGFDTGAKFIATNGEDGIAVSSREPQDWARAIAPLLKDPHYRRTMGELAHEITQKTCPTWEEAFAEDILRRWQEVAD
ncbi:glycosyltransferase [Candidatus Synechococcus calcipolaris G9]|uniref:Glycosyltransferase n=1 Tax=Candidatus Synechococcus calcipolaris G9 TaxID=1497997 RepID=A0ABT6F2F7_9SYNE|nr:glycosyltransferase [Candidatus Synechococcus calcipolaris]MDG2992036.1 glycosyltransferase [Candidatus Synechococcus calcipolaris G9]